MNDKLRGILRTAWNEPRHFFFWLAMFSVCGLVALAVLAGLGVPPRTPSIFLIGLGFILCLVTSVPAFILAWIPPVRRLFSWLLRRRFFGLCCLFTLVALFYATENWRGRRAWENFKREWEAKGERLDLASIIPPPVPDDQNFFETPLWNDMHFVQTNDLTVWSDTNWGKHVMFDAFGPKGNDAPSIGNLAKGQRVDLHAWQAFYRGSNNLFAAMDGPATNYFPVAKEPQTPAADVLLALSKFEQNRQLLIAASARPHARFWINYDAGFAALLPHLARMKASAQYLCLHSEAALKTGDKEIALADVTLSLRLIETIRNEPILISHLVRIATLEIALQPVWQGLADRQWTEVDLNSIESELGKLDFLADYHFAMRGERAFDLWWVDYIRKAGGPRGFELATILNQGPGLGEWETALGMAMFQLMPAGWFDQNKLSLCRMHEKYLLPLVDQASRLVLPSAVQQSQSVIERRHGRPYDGLSPFLLPAADKAAEKFARAQTSVDLARLACALERYRLENSQFPETLDTLAPKFIEKLPHDVINGQPLKYRRTDDGAFVLYSIGWNEKDDGGAFPTTRPADSKERDRYGDSDRIQEGDWVWRYPAK